MQADEVVTKSQESGRKANKTYTATLEDDSDQFVAFGNENNIFCLSRQPLSNAAYHNKNGRGCF